jgi:hypothetical protein
VIDDPIDMLRHMLGLKAWVWTDEPRKPPHRNYAAIGHDDPMFLRMESEGLVERFRRCEQYDWWRTTDTGRAAAFASVEQRKRSRHARRYDRWLEISDAIGMKFGEYLKSDDPDIVAHRNER